MTGCGRCRDCKHYEPAPELFMADEGTCKLLSGFEYENSLAFGAEGLTVLANFGCVQFEAKEASNDGR